jgi:DNA (cytosine-5)-methyltransferase 1
MSKGINTTCDEGQTLIPTTGGGFDVAHCLRGEGFDAGEDGTGRGTPLVPVGVFQDSEFGVRQYGDMTGPLDTDGHSVAIAFSGKDYGADAGEIAPTLRAMGHGASHANGGGQVAVAISESGEIASTLRTGGNDHADSYNSVAVAFQRCIARNGRGNMGDVVNALQAQSGSTGKGDAAPCVAVAMRESGQGYWMEDDIAGTLRAEGEDRPSRPSHVIGIPPAMQVRRLTPRECERLQGFPDDYTLIPHRGKPAADGPRYKALGNSMAVPCMRWIGERIAMVEQLKEEMK